jgi:hypothetical protein
MDRIRNSWSLVKEAWAVLRQDRELALFPVLSGIVSVLVLASFALPALLLFPWAELSHSGSGSFRSELGAHFGPLHYVGIFLYYLATYFVVVFFNAGLVACVKKRFAGEDPTLRDGLDFSLQNVGRIFQWALLSATVGTILRGIEERAGWLGQIVVGLLGMAWSVVSFFVVPVLVYERVGPIDALRRSADTLRKTWGEALVANIGMGWAFGLLSLAGALVLTGGIVGGIALLAGGATVLGIVAMVGTLVLCLVYWTALGIIQSALQGIFLTACYEYATTGAVPSAFTADYVMAAYRPKR